MNNNAILEDKFARYHAKISPYNVTVITIVNLINIHEHGYCTEAVSPDSKAYFLIKYQNGASSHNYLVTDGDVYIGAGILSRLTAEDFGVPPVTINNQKFNFCLTYTAYIHLGLVEAIKQAIKEYANEQ